MAILVKTWKFLWVYALTISPHSFREGNRLLVNGKLRWLNRGIGIGHPKTYGDFSREQNRMIYLRLRMIFLMAIQSSRLSSPSPLSQSVTRAGETFICFARKASLPRD
jgi:hypothetical protein